MNTVIEFVDVAKQNVADSGSNALTQTGDSLLLFLAIFVALIGVLCFIKVKVKSNANNISNLHIRNFVNSKKTSAVLIVLITLTLALLSVVGINQINSQKAFADNTNSFLDAPSTIKAYVDKQNNTVSFDKVNIENKSDAVVKVNSVATTLCQDVSDNKCNWQFSLDNFEIYNNVVNTSSSLSTQNVTFAGKQIKTLSINSNIDIQTATSLIGKQVLSITFNCEVNPMATVSFSSNFSDNDDINVNHMESIDVKIPASFYADDNNNLVIKNADGEIVKTAEHVSGDEPYKFLKWSCFNFDVYKNVPFPFEYDIDFCANYEKLDSNLASVEFVMNGYGNQVSNTQVEMFSKISEPSVPVANGYVFGGWYKDSQYSEKWDFSKDIVSSNHTVLYARWQIAITFTVNDEDLGSVVTKDGEVLADAGTSYTIYKDSIIIGSGQDMYWAYALPNSGCSFINWDDSSSPSVYPAPLQTGTTFTANFESDVNYFSLSCAEIGNTNITLNLVSMSANYETPNLEWSADAQTWTEIIPQDNAYHFPTLNESLKQIYIRGLNETISSEDYYWTFQSDKKYYAKGNIMSLLYGDDYDTDEALSVEHSYCFYGLFDCYSDLGMESKLLSCPKLPALWLAPVCYAKMFANCKYIIDTPELPAGTIYDEETGFYIGEISDSCYAYMFENCKSIVKAPHLKAGQVWGYCYYGMFSGCSSLTLLPQTEDGIEYTLPSRSLDECCYAYMFENCSSLVSLPILPAASYALDKESGYYYTDGCLGWGCYSHMFYGCQSLVTVADLPAGQFADYCYESMFENCTNLKSAPMLMGMEGWGGTSLCDHCFYSMYKGCKSLTTPALLPGPALYFPFFCTYGWTLSSYAMAHMYEGCEKLECAVLLASPVFSIWGSNCNFYSYDSSSETYNVETYNCPNCYESIFEGCVSLKFVDLVDFCAFNEDNPWSAYQIVPYEKISDSTKDMCPMLNWIKDVPINDDTRILLWRDEIDDFDYTEYYGPSGFPKGWTLIGHNYR